MASRCKPLRDGGQLSRVFAAGSALMLLGGGCRGLIGADDFTEGAPAGAGGSRSANGGDAGSPDARTGDAGAQASAEPPCLDATAGFGEPFETELDLGCWGLLNAEKAASLAADSSLSVLRIVPTPQSAWYAENTGPLLHRAVTGDFVAETRVTVRNPTGALGTTTKWSGAGLVVFNPASPAPEPLYYMIDVGSSRTAGTSGIRSEHPNALTRQMERQEKPSENTARLRICRVGSVITLAYAPSDSDAWVAFPAYDAELPELPDLPSRVLVGLTAYQYPLTAGPLVSADFDYFQLRLGQLDPNDCTAAYP